MGSNVLTANMFEDSESEQAQSVQPNDDILINQTLGWPFNYINWCCTSQSTLRDAETAILENMQEPFTNRYVNIGSIVGDEDIQVWTLSMNQHKPGTPVVLIHGLCSGLALWVLNLDELSHKSNSPIHAIDLPGFGRSSRPPFGNDGNEVELQLVKILEAWRHEMKIEKIILLGHSFGGYLAYSYSIAYPERIAHLICTDPWGFNKKPDNLADMEKIPWHHRLGAKIMAYCEINPMGPVRLLGPFGRQIIKQLRGRDLIPHFSKSIDDPLIKISNYVFHANAQNPTGENAFTSMMNTYGWAKNPMYLRIESLDKNINLTLIYGSHTFIDHFPAQEIANRRSGSFVDYHVLDSGHHVYAETAMEFNTIILNVCSSTDGLFV